MVVDTVLYNTKIFFNGALVEAGLAINEGRIVKIAKETNLPNASTMIDLENHIALPGLIDSHVHLRDQDLAYKEDFFSGTSAAAAGGVTTVIDMPNNRPVTMDSFSFEERVKLAKNRILVNVAFNSAFPERLEEMFELIEAGVVGFKVYLSSGVGGLNIDDDEVLFKAFCEAAKGKVPVVVHAEDKQVIVERLKKIKKKERFNAKAYVESRPVEAEVKSIKRIIKLVDRSGVNIHFCHITSAMGLDVIKKAKKRKLPITCEVTPHHLLLTSKAYETSGFFALTNPPLRTKKDVFSLWGGLKNGSIDLMASDHAPHTFDEKAVGSVWEVKPGVPGLETFLPLMLTEVNKGRLTLAELVNLVSEMPARVFSFQNRGMLLEGKCADIVIVDMKKEYRINSSNFYSKSKFSPFDGWKIKGKPIKTFISGKLVMDEGEVITEEAAGQIISNLKSNN